MTGFIISALIYHPLDTLIGVGLTATGIPFYFRIHQTKTEATEMNQKRLTISLSLFFCMFAVHSFAQISATNAYHLKLLSQIKMHTGPVFSLAFSTNGKLLVSGGSAEDHSVRVWDVPSASPHVLLNGNQKQVAAVGFSADGTKVMSSWL